MGRHGFHRNLFSVLALSLLGSVSRAEFCQDDKIRLEARSRELAVIAEADQNDRVDWEHKSPEEMREVAERDAARRRRVGEIFGEGCFSKAEDYSAAALVYQHGNVPDHFFQAFLWSKRAVELGDARQKRLMALGIDRYLVSTGRRQLFGSQAAKPDWRAETCWCLPRIERSFPDRRRQELAGKTLREAFGWLQELNAGKRCPSRECGARLRPSPKGTVPGFW